MKVKLLNRVWLFATSWTAAYQAPLSMGFPRQEYWSELPLPSPLFIIDKIKIRAIENSVRIDIAYYLDTPLQYSCLGNPMDGGAWWAAVHEVAKSRTQLSDFSLSCTREGNGNPLQCSCLENPRDRGAWWPAVYGVSQSRTRLKWLSSSSSSIR